MSEILSGKQLFLVDQDHKRVNKNYIADLLFNCSDEPAIQIAFRIAEMKKDGIKFDEVLEKRLATEIRLMNTATILFADKTQKHKYITK